MNKTEITKDTFPEYRTNPMFDGLPDSLKQPQAYDKVQRALIETLTCGKVHSDPLQMSECQKCTQNMVERRELLKKLGFRSVEQYMAWRKVHETIQGRISLPKYND